MELNDEAMIYVKTIEYLVRLGPRPRRPPVPVSVRPARGMARAGAERALLPAAAAAARGDKAFYFYILDPTSYGESVILF